MFRSRKSSATAAAATQQIVLRDAATPAGDATAVAQRKERELQQAQFEADELAEMLPVRKPKSFVDGTLSGVKLATLGVLGGAAAVVAMPIIGAREGAKSGGVKGAAVGLASGVVKGALSGTVVATAGALTGASQVVRGVAQTPFSAAAAASGKQWDKDSRKWVNYSLPEDELAVKEADAEWVKKLKARREMLKQMKNEASGAGSSSSSSGSGVEDTDFYDLLQVSPDATPEQIKRAYLKLARVMHPDKNPDDPGANDKFQKLGEAYQVLSNEDSRARYDMNGKEGLDKEKFMDASAMYAMLFGSEKFDDLIGELQIAAMLQQAETMGADETPSMRHMSHKQRAREVKCAIGLAERLSKFVDGEMDEASFGQDAIEQAKELSQEAFGQLLTNTIGYIYAYKASQHLNPALTKNLLMRKHQIGANAKALKAMGDMLFASRAAAKLPEEEQQKAMGKDMRKFLKGAWFVSVVDVESTLRHVCKKVLTDTSTPKEGRKRRAQALLILGEKFLEATSEKTKHTDGTTKTLEEILQEMMPEINPAEFDAAAASAAAGEGGEDDDEDELFADLEADIRRGDAAAAAAPAPEPPSREVLEAMSIKELKAVMIALGVSPDGLLEKSEFVDAVCSASATSSSSSSNSNSPPQAPPPPPPRAAAEAKAKDLDLLGQRVKIDGLVSKPELNGTFGTAVSFDDSNGRYLVTLESTGGFMALKPANVTAAASTGQ